MANKMADSGQAESVEPGMTYVRLVLCGTTEVVP